VRRLAIAFLLIVCVPLPARGWGCEAHETIALLADKHLTAHARKMVYELLEAAPVDPRTPRSCHPTTPTVFVEASFWADDVRRDKTSPFHETGPWHFIDIPRGVSSGDLRRFCPARKGCVLQAIDEQIRVLRTARGDRRRADALRFIIHLIGDLHQPLHAATNNDRGGNCVPVAYFGMEPRLPPNHTQDDAYRPNLHAVWDTDIIRRILRHRDPAWFAGVIEHRFQSQMVSWQRQPIDLNQWAWETHQVAEETVYGLLSTPIPPEPPTRETPCDRMSQRMLTLRERVTKRYQKAAVPVVEEQLAKAAIRLAMVLNQLWP
jgi:hypothetical protein